MAEVVRICDVWRCSGDGMVINKNAEKFGVTGNLGKNR